MIITQDLVRFFSVLLVLLVGFVLMRLSSRLFIKIFRFKTQLNHENIGVRSLYDKVFFSIILIIALVYLGFGSLENLLVRMISLLPKLLRFLLVFILGILVIGIIMRIFEQLIGYTRLKEVLYEEDMSAQILPFIFLSIRFILYLILVHITFGLIDIAELQSLTSIILYPAVGLFFLLIFVALMNPIRDFVAGYYIKSLYQLRSGREIKLNNQLCSVNNLSWLTIELKSANGELIIMPNSELLKVGINLKPAVQEIRTLEQIKNLYVAQLPSMCGPATAQLVLSMFGIKSDQEEIARLAGSIARKKDSKIAGTAPIKLIKAVEKFTDRNVIGSWISYNKIYHLRNEVATWLQEGALIIIDYKKKYLFPSAKTGHYSVVVGVRGFELLVVDPNKSDGGVYFVDARDIEVGMDTVSEMTNDKRGYIVLAPKGTSAYKRIEENTIYGHISMYDKVTKALEQKINKVTNIPALSEMIPPFVRKKIRLFEKNQISPLWKP